MKRIPTKRDRPRRERPELFYKPSEVLEQFHTPTLRKMISRKRATPRTKKDLGLTHNRREQKTVRLDAAGMEKLRLKVFRRSGGHCERCKKNVYWSHEPLSPHSFHLAHIKSRGAGGADTARNTRGLCRDCHLIGDHNPKPCPPKPFEREGE